MYALTVVLHVLACSALILIVLLQKGKGADLGAAFGGASQTVFGSRGAGGFLSKLTTASAVIFMMTCLSLAYMSSRRIHKTVMEEVHKQDTSAAAIPGEDSASPEQPSTAPVQATDTRTVQDSSPTSSNQTDQQ